MNKYDSTSETLKHIRLVNKELTDFSIELIKRAQEHDESKLHDPEKELFDEMTPILETLEYGTENYKNALDKLKPALDHHYSNNSHHPQYYPNGIDEMTLYDIVEMFCDWKAAVKRTKGGDINKSIQINKDRFNINSQLIQIFQNTINIEKK